MEKSIEGPGKIPRIVQVMCFNGVPRQDSQPSSVALPHQWDGQMQDFLRSSQTGGGNPPLMDAVPWDDAKAFLSAFEQVAEVCQWPREEWVGRLLPGLRGGVEQFFCRLSPQERQDYGKVKATLLRADTFRMELKRQHFRQCTYQELEGPRRVYGQLQELCRQWLKPERHSKEQILELIIQEQLLGMLPLEVRRFVQDCAPEDCVQTVTLAETFLLARQQTAQSWNWQVPVPGMSTNTMAAAAPQVQRCAEASQKGNGETNLTANIMPPARNSDAVPSPQLQQGAGIGLMQEPVKVKEEPDLDLRPTCSEFVRDVTSVGSSSTASVLTQEGFLTPMPQTIPQPVQQEPIFPPISENEQPIPNTPLGNIMLGGIKTEENRDSGSDTDVSFDYPSPEDSSWSHEKDQGSEKNQGSSKTNPPHQVPQEETSSEIQRKKNGRCYPPVKKHLCSECGHAAYYLSDLLKHMKTHSNEVYKCSQCGKGFKAKTTLTAHQKTHMAPDISSSTNLAEDQTEGGYICCECGISKATEIGLTEHMKVHTSDKHFQCEICGEVFKLKNSLIKHQMLHNNVKRIVTLKGGNEPPVRQGVKTLRVVLTKLGSRTGKLHKCNECGYGFDKSSQLTNHMRSHTRQRPYKCHDCGRSFRWLSSLQQHSEVICPKRSIPSASFEGHQVTQTVQKQIKEEPFLNRDIKLEDEELLDEAAAAAARESMGHQAGMSSLMGHLQQTPMPQLQAAPASVAECDVTLTDEEELIHLLQQGGSKPSHLAAKARIGRPPKNMELSKTSRYEKLEKKHQCPDCDYRAYYLSELERHRNRHNYTNTNPYRCQTCGKTFAKKSSLNNHYKKIPFCRENAAKRIPVGPGDKKHTCSKCGHKTYKLSTLLVHMRTHGGENPYRCQQCGQTFSFHADLMRHETLAHQLESSSSSRKPSFFKHVRKHKADNMKPTQADEEYPLPEKPNNSQVIQQDAPVIAMIRERWRYDKQEEQLQEEEEEEKEDPDPVERSEEATVQAKEDVSEKKAAFRAILGKFAYCKNAESDQTRPSTDEAALAEAKPSYKCITCGQTFEMKIDLTLHENTHVMPMPMESRERQPDFSSWSKNLLKYHLGQARPKPHPCCDCGKEFYCRDNLVIHLKTHGFENIYECGECDEVFVQQDELARHRRSHAEQEY